MKWFYNLKIAVKLLSCFIIVALITGSVGIFGIFEIININNDQTFLYEKNTKNIGELAYIGTQYGNINASVRDVILNPAKSKTQIAQIDNYYNEINDNFKDYENGFLTEDEKVILNKIKAMIEKVKPLNEKTIQAVLSEENDQAIKILNEEIQPINVEITSKIHELLDLNVDLAAKTSANSDKRAHRSTFIMTLLVAICTILSIVFGIFVSKIISKPLKTIKEVANRLAAGDLDVNIDIDSKDEIGQLSKSFENIIVTFNNLAGDVNMLAHAAVEGKLSIRADANNHKGEYGRIVQGINDTLNSIIEPINEMQEVMKLMSLNDYSIEMSGVYKGTLGDLADSVNSVRARLLSVKDAIVRVSRGDTSRLEEFYKIGKRCDNDELMPAVIRMNETIRNLIDDASMLANAAVNGDLEVRGDISRFEGGYLDVIDGMNKTMDAVAKPLQEIAAVMTDLEKRNLNVSMIGDYKGEYAKVKEDINTTINSFNDLLNEISVAAQQVTSGSKQISDSSIALSQGATEQASSVEELTASLEEISAQTKHNAENANKANELAEHAKSNALQGDSQMKGMLKAMEDINESSSNISKIIKVIDDIAFQTNMLALNAAVEAARAGQHGKGFAVVAEEVKNLAARSANAAKETTDMIESSIKKSEEGTKIAKETAEALNIIVTEIEKVANIVNDINIASNEQALGIEQINQGIMQVSHVIQTNSATSEEGAAASEELSSQAITMQEMVAKFKLKHDTKEYGKIDKLSPEVLKMLDDMSERRKIGLDEVDENFEGRVTKKSKIVLSDNEFGKY